MPVTARLSKKFYDRLGEDIANELVDWFNAVDSTYQTQLRNLNETNSRRFLADVRGEIGTVRGEIGTLRSDMAVEIGTVRSDLLAELATVRADLRAELASVRADLRAELASVRADLIKWMFTFGIATVISLGGLIVALEKVFK